MGATIPARKWRFKLKDTVLTRMAAAIGDDAYNTDGTPKHTALLGTNDTGTASMILNGKQKPRDDTLATIGMRLAMADPKVGDVFDALREVLDVIEITDGASA